MEDRSETQSTPAWKTGVGWTAAILMAALWLVAGVWKLTDLSAFQVKLTQLLVPVSLSMPATLALVVSELTAGILLLIPAWRRIGGYFSAVLLLVFMAYVAYNYEPLRGADCSCFPWLERAVGPAFFWSDGAMVALALVAAWFSRPPARLRQAGVALAAVVALTGVAFAVNQSAAPVAAGELPATIAIEGGMLVPVRKPGWR
ncbi:MAG: MauE/DoxX family redox-associated membrane protein, partial [Bryobacterales bacterium]